MKLGQRIRIESDGTGWGTKITDAESGADLTPEIMSAAIFMDAGDIVRADLTVKMPRVESDAIVTSVERQCPFCGHSKQEADST